MASALRNALTPAEIVAAADQVLSKPPPRGWLDCALAIDLIILRAGGCSPMGAAVQEYQTPREALRRIRRAGGWQENFAATVAAQGYRPSGAATGAVGYVRNTDTLFGFACAVCVQPGAWLVPVEHGYTIAKDAMDAWLH